MLFSLTEIKAQVCSGALGDPIINIDFGRGADLIGPPLGNSFTNYTYTAGQPDNGLYTIAQSTRGMHSSGNGWFQVDNHTPNDPTGYMMIVDASYTPGIFYQTTISSLCPNTTYEFAAWIINLLNYPGIKPNITFVIETTNGTLLKTYNTGDIFESAQATWKQYATTFTTSNSANIVLKIINNGPGGNGNDIALDDITFRACGPVITPSISDIATNFGTIINVCEGSSASYTLSANISGGYIDPVYQWQVNTASGWADIAGETNTQTMITSNPQPGTYQYRMIAAERANINSPNCRVSSAPLTIKVNAKPNPTVSNNGPVCFGSSLQLTTTNITVAAGDVVSYKWDGPNNFSSTQKDPLLTNMDASKAGIYQLTFSQNGCVEVRQTTVNVLPQVNAQIKPLAAPICEGETVQLEASGGTTYAWLPADGLSDLTSATPTVSPSKTTTYTVNVSENGCLATATITVPVLKKITANAGADKKIVEGQRIVLDGQATGDDLTYSWSPTDYLDDPTKLNPIANPPKDITYTLTVQSPCNTVTDEVFIRVYPKVEIPNTFTPNGDGVNDRWLIPSIEGYDKVKLRVVNRYGQLVFETTDAKQTWDGKADGKALPAGTYYYTLYINDDKKGYSGWVLLAR